MITLLFQEQRAAARIAGEAAGRKAGAQQGRAEGILAGVRQGFGLGQEVCVTDKELWVSQLRETR